MNKTDITFYLLMAGLVVKEIIAGYQSMQAGNPTDWVVIGLGIVSTLIYGFYGKLTGTREIPKIE